MKKTITILITILIMTGLLLVGCQQAEVVVTPSPTVSATPAPSTEPEITGFSFTDSMGRVTEFDNVPETIISLSPTLTEIVYALDLGEKLIGRTDWCNYPEQVFDVASVGNMDVPNFEVIVSLNPDVVVVSLITNEETVNKLEEAGIKCVVIDEETTFEGAYGNIQLMGTLLGADDKAASIVTEMKDRVADITSKVAGAAPKTVYYVMGYGEYGDFTAGAGTFISEMIKMAGGTNVADDTTDWSYSVEKLVSHNPDILICSMWAPAEGLKTTTGYMDLKAVKTNKVYTIDDDIIQRIGPRITEGLYAMAKALHPTLF